MFAGADSHFFILILCPPSFIFLRGNLGGKEAELVPGVLREGVGKGPEQF